VSALWLRVDTLTDGQIAQLSMAYIGLAEHFPARIRAALERLAVPTLPAGTVILDQFPPAEPQ